MVRNKLPNSIILCRFRYFYLPIYGIKKDRYNRILERGARQTLIYMYREAIERRLMLYDQFWVVEYSKYYTVVSKVRGVHVRHCVCFLLRLMSKNNYESCELLTVDWLLDANSIVVD